MPEFWPGHDGELESADDYPLAPYRLRVIDLDEHAAAESGEEASATKGTGSSGPCC